VDDQYHPANPRPLTLNPPIAARLLNSTLSSALVGTRQPSFSIVFLWVVLATCADICFTTATRFMSADFFVGLMCYMLTAFLAVVAFHRQQWGWIIIVWSCFSFVLAMLLSVVLFREPFTLKRALASSFVLLAILLND
jgi:multidrug transporter EmrE-like cation transporter